MTWDVRNDNTFKDNLDTHGVWKKEGERQYHLYFGMSDPNDHKGGRLFTLTPEGHLVSEIFVFTREEAVIKNAVKLTPETLVGEWVFVYAQHSLYPMPLSFDRIIYTKDGDAFATSTIVSREINGKYSLSGDQLNLKNMKPYERINQVTASIEDDGKVMILNPNGPMPVMPDWIFVRPELLLPNDEVVGTWVKDFGIDNMVMEINFMASGRYEKIVKNPAGEIVTSFAPSDPNIHQYYRIWTSKYGKAITMFDIIPRVGLLSDAYRYEVVEGSLVLTPLIAFENPQNKITEEDYFIYKPKVNN